MFEEEIDDVTKSELPVKKRVLPESYPDLTSFEDAGLDARVAAAITTMGWTAPTPVQGMCLPATLAGRDVAGFAQTGTGKTGVFLVTVADRLMKNPSLERKRAHVAYPDCIVLTPTRELTIQIDQDAQKFFEPLGLSSISVYGGVEVEKQARLLNDGPRLIIGTPGRLKDLFQRKLIDLSQCSMFVCDEADRMFDMGFIEDVEFFLDKIPETAQKLLFSATTNEQVKELAFEYLDQPLYISVTPETITPAAIEQHAVICDTSNKLQVMLGLLQDHQPVCSIIFTNTKLTAEWLYYKLAGNGIDVDLITGDLPQKKRISLMQRIKEGKIKALIATDVVSRGLHISKVSHVYNFDVPEDPASYVHRIGRTARAGASGSAYTLICEDYGQHMLGVQALLGDQVKLDASWFNPSFLDIKDKAGNPFASDGPLNRKFERPGASARDSRKPQGQGGKFAQQKQGGPKPLDHRQSDRPGSQGNRHGNKPQHHRDQNRPKRPHHDRRPQVAAPVPQVMPAPAWSFKVLWKKVLAWFLPRNQ
jgi:ATP-dependent RNA helicase RhlB